MNEANYSEVSEFIFLGLSIYRPTQYFLFAFSTISYAFIFLGNFSVVLTVILDPHLHSPMYFLLANLSFVDFFLKVILLNYKSFHFRPTSQHPPTPPTPSPPPSSSLRAVRVSCPVGSSSSSPSLQVQEGENPNRLDPQIQYMQRKLEFYSAVKNNDILNFACKWMEIENTLLSEDCIFQMFVLHVLGECEMVLLVVMAWDRYVAICKPLHYLTIMSPRKCILLLIGAWIIGLIHSVTQLAFVIHLPFCSSNEIDSFYCDLPRFIKLACIDTYRMEFLVTAESGLILVTTFFLLILSYIFILFTVWKQSLGSLSKALSTLSAHISVVVLFFGPCIFVYVWPFPTIPVDKFLAILDFMITPILNPAIYTLRNIDMKVAMRRLSKQLLSRKSAC